MYRIQKAVIKAKKHGAGANPIQRNYAPSTESPLEKLEYTTTQVVPCHPDQLEKNRIVAGFSNNDHSQLFRTLRTQVLQKMRANNWKSLAITSASPGEGKSVVASNLAVAIAREVNQTVLLADVDLTNPGLIDCFGIQPDKGLADYLKGEATLEEIIINPGLERLVILPGSGSLINSSEIISSPKMVSLFQETKSRYKSRFVIYDMPPILPTDDVLSSVGHTDAVLLVVEDGRNSQKDLERAVRQLKGTAFMGYVLNKFHKGSWLI